MSNVDADILPVSVKSAMAHCFGRPATRMSCLDSRPIPGAPHMVASSSMQWLTDEIGVQRRMLR